MIGGYIRLIVLMVGALPWSGCLYVAGSLPPCSSIQNSPVLMTVEVSGEPYYSRRVRADVRHTLWIRLTERNGVALWVFRPNLRQLACVRLAEAELEDWISGAESLLREPRGFELLDPVDAPDEEMVIVSSRQAQAAVAVGELTEEGREAVRALVCLAAEAFGNRFENAFEEISPALAARTGFPGSCADGGASDRPADE